MDPAGNVLLNMTADRAANAVRSGDAEAVRKIRGQFAICQQQGKNDSDGSVDRSSDALLLGQTRRRARIDYR